MNEVTQGVGKGSRPLRHDSGERVTEFREKGSTRAHTARVIACLDWLNLHGIPAVPIATTGIPVRDGRGGWTLRRNRRQVGIADIIACVSWREGARVSIGQLVLIEVKTGKARTTAAQEIQRQRFGTAGALCLIIRDVIDLAAALHPYRPLRSFAGVRIEAK